MKNTLNHTRGKGTTFWYNYEHFKQKNATKLSHEKNIKEPNCQTNKSPQESTSRSPEQHEQLNRLHKIPPYNNTAKITFTK